MKNVPEKYLLYAEDDDDDREIVTDVLRQTDPSLQVICLPNGRETLQFLESVHPGDPLPCCIVLDINMPIWDGFYTLEQLKSNTNYAELPVFMFSSSLSAKDHDRSLSLGAVDFIHKPVQMSEMKKVGNRFASFCQRPRRKK